MCIRDRQCYPQHERVQFFNGKASNEDLAFHSPNDGQRGVQANSFYYPSIKAWNNPPREVVDAKSIKTFKERLEAKWEHKKNTF